VQLTRHFTREGQSPYAHLSFEPRSTRMTRLDGSVVFAMDNVYVPTQWDQTATDVLAQKYFRRKGCNHHHVNSFYNSHYSSLYAGNTLKDPGHEVDLRETIHRIVGAMAAAGERLGYFDEANAEIFYDEMSFLMATQRMAPNSPQWFNTGLGWAYGLKGSAQGHYHADSGTAVASEDAYTYSSSSACFIQSVTDDLMGAGGITDLWTREARVFKHGGGSGSNVSAIRGKNEPLSGGGTSSGLMSFLRVSDRAAGAIKSGGTTRRAARIVSLDVDHPDVEEFISWKVAEERKVAMLVAGARALKSAWDAMCGAALTAPDVDVLQNPSFIKAVRQARKNGVPLGFLQEAQARIQQRIYTMPIHTMDLDYEGEAYETVSAQNANNSIRLPDTFMTSVDNDGEWTLFRRVDGAACKTLSSRALWKSISEAAWSCADPGLQFDTTINFWHTCPEAGRINASNPCSEFHFLDNTACNLASLNLVQFLEGDGSFDIHSFCHAVALTTIALDITVSMSQYPTALMAQLSEDYRPLGLGYANLGGLLMRMGLAYDSPKGREIAASITSLMTATAYHTSIDLAKLVGPFRGYEAANMCRVLGNHAELANGYKTLEGDPGLGVTYVPLTSAHPIAVAARSVWKNVVSMAPIHGVRNSQVTVLAPTGTIGLVMGCDTTGVEPDFALVKFKKLAGGGYMRLVNSGIPAALDRLGYTQAEAEAIVNYVGGKTLVDCKAIPYDELVRRFSAETVAEWDKALLTAFDPSFVLPVDALTQAFGGKAVKEFLLEVGGHGTLEGAPHLKSIHLPVFDCASRCGIGGTRSIAPMGHLMMMAVVQPFVSGAISKTVNLPGDATVDEVSDLYRKAWQLGLKAVALYRDGSKLSQPLASSLESLDVVDTEVIDDPVAPPAAKVVAAAEILARHAVRRKLPSRRGGYTQAVKIQGTKVYLRTGEYEDGTLGEIFLDTYKEGAGFKAILNAFAVAISIGLQYGVPLEEFCDAFLFTKFEPNGPVRDHDVVKMCLSLPDFIFRDLAISYLHRYELAHVSPEDLIAEGGPRKPMSVGPSNSQTFGIDPQDEVSTSDLHRAVGTTPPAKKPDIRSEAILKGYTGDPCPTCGHSTMVRSGTCARCTTCGSTSGCS